MDKTNCIYCGKVKDVQSRGTIKSGKKQFYCKQCKKFFTNGGAPKMLILDIETSHILFEGWDTGEQYVRPDQIRKNWFVICWSAKWLFGDKIYSDVVTSKEAINGDDKRCLKQIHALMDESDIVIWQNGDKFDGRKLNWKFIKHGFSPNNHYLSIDTLKKAKQIIDPPSYGLDGLGKELGFGEKDKMENEDWRKAEAGDTVSLKKMVEYCKKDVIHNEEEYLILRPWMKTHPNLAAYVDLYQEMDEDETLCRRCLQPINSSKFSKSWYSLAGKKYKRTNCPHCGCVIRISKIK